MLNLTYDETLSRVVIEVEAEEDSPSSPSSPGGATNLSDLIEVTVERSMNGNIWETVRGGKSVKYFREDGFILHDYEFLSDKENFYRVIAVDPEPGLLLTDTAGDTASTPDDASLDIPNELELGIDLALDSYTPGNIVYMLSKYDFNADQRSYALRINSSDTLQLLISSNGTGFSTASAGVAIPANAGERIALFARVAVDDSTGDWEAKFFRADTIDSAKIQFGNEPSGTLGVPSLFDGTAPLVVGATSDGISPVGPGTVFAVRVTNLETSTVVADPNFDEQDHGDTSFDDDAGLTWTINNDAEIIGEELESGSITPSLNGQIWLKSIKYPFLNSPITLTDWSGIGRDSSSGDFEIVGRSLPITVSDKRKSRKFTLEVKTDTDEEERDMDLTLASGEQFFIHLPADCPVPGGYVSIGNTGEDRKSMRTARRFFSLPCRVSAKPGPDIVGTTLIWETVLNLYGSWEQLLASNPSWADLFETFSSPEDLVTL